jgi:molybdate transport system ATP-binding protein
MSGPTLHASFTKRFAGGAEIRVPSLNISGDGTTVLFGPSGAGKTTILRCLAGLEIPDDGAIQFRAKTWFDGRTGQNVKPAHRRIGFVPQDYALFPHLTIAANLSYGLSGQPAATIKTRVDEIMDWLGLTGLAGRFPGTLSGGQQQRVALARALAWDPQLVLLDEPLAALDLPSRHRLRNELRPLLARFNCPVLLVTHDRLEAAVLGDEVVVMDRGEVLQQGSVADVFNRPVNLAAARVVGTDTILPCRLLQVTEGLATLAVGRAQLFALATPAPIALTPSHVCIRAEDVILARTVESHTSARNQLTALIKSVNDEGMLLRFELDCGFPLKALLTRQAGTDLALKPGESIVAMIKAPQVHLI